MVRVSEHPARAIDLCERTGRLISHSTHLSTTNKHRMGQGEEEATTHETDLSIGCLISCHHNASLPA